MKTKLFTALALFALVASPIATVFAAEYEVKTEGRQLGLPSKMNDDKNKEDKEDNEKGEDKVKTAKPNFCENITAVEARMKEMQTKKTQMMSDQWANKDTKREDHQNEMDEKMDEHRDARDIKIDEHFTAMLDKANLTPEQKAKMEVMQKTALEALGTKREDVTKAIDAFRVGLSQLTAEQQASMKVAMDTFVASSKKAYDKAKVDCTSGKDSVTVAATFKADMDAARTTLMEARKTIVGDMKFDAKALRAEQRETRTEIRTGFRAFWQKLFGARKEAKVEVETEVETEN